ncbi:hypothetical protein LWC33_28360 [Pseudonocardia sp. RS11V-5]|nr:hypothetical protein [Pseudonocardia terrae]
MTTLAPPPMAAPDPNAPNLGPPGDNRRKEWVRRYFRPSPPLWEWMRAVRQMRLGGAFAVLALCLLLAAPWTWAAGDGIIAALFAAMGFVSWRTWHFARAYADEKSSGELLDRTLDADLRRAVHEALRRFGLSRSDLVQGPDGAGRGPHDPIVVVGPAPDARHRSDFADRIRRFTAYSGAVLCVTRTHIAVLTFRLALDTGGRSDVDAHEIRFEHISAIRTATRPAKDLTASEVPGFSFAKKASFTTLELEITATDGAVLAMTNEISQPRPAELRTPTDIASFLPVFSAVLRDHRAPTAPDVFDVVTATRAAAREVADAVTRAPRRRPSEPPPRTAPPTLPPDAPTTLPTTSSGGAGGAPGTVLGALRCAYGPRRIEVKVLIGRDAWLAAGPDRRAVPFRLTEGATRLEIVVDRAGVVIDPVLREIELTRGPTEWTYAAATDREPGPGKEVWVALYAGTGLLATLRADTSRSGDEDDPDPDGTGVPRPRTDPDPDLAPT